MLLPLARSKPRPLTLMRPSVRTSAWRSAILQGGARGDPSHNVLPYVRERSIRVRRPDDVRHRVNADAAVESCHEVTLGATPCAYPLT